MWQFLPPVIGHNQGMLTDVAVVVSAPVPAFELGVVSEIFGLPRIDPSLPSYRYAVCATERTGLPTSTGFTITPTHGLRRLASADLIIVTGAAPPLPAPAPALCRALRAAVARGAMVASVCTGAFTLAAAGLLDGRRATTHWAYTDLLARLHPRIEVEPDALYVVDEPLATSAGSSAAIDLCLHLLRRAHGAQVTNRIARELVVPAHRNGGQNQYARVPVAEPRPSGAPTLTAVLDWAVENLAEDLCVDLLAQRAALSTRTFARHFAELTGTTPATWIRNQRLDRAELLLEHSDTTLNVIAHRCGFGSVDTLHRHFRRRRGITPTDYRRAFHTDAGGRGGRRR